MVVNEIAPPPFRITTARLEFGHQTLSPMSADTDSKWREFAGCCGAETRWAKRKKTA